MDKFQACRKTSIKVKVSAIAVWWYHEMLNVIDNFNCLKMTKLFPLFSHLNVCSKILSVFWLWNCNKVKTQVYFLEWAIKLWTIVHMTIFHLWLLLLLCLASCMTCAEQYFGGIPPSRGKSVKSFTPAFLRLWRNWLVFLRSTWTLLLLYFL